MSLRHLFCESLPETARTPRNRFLPAAERGLIIACHDRRKHGEHHRSRDQ